MSLENPRFVNVDTLRVWRPFLIIILGFVLINLVSIYEMRNSQAEVKLITKHAAMDIELVARLSRDVDRKRVLIEDYILEKQPKDKQRVETELAVIDTEIVAASRSYEPIGDETDERAIWQKLDAEIGAIEPRVTDIISLSRRNMDGEAQAVRKSLETNFGRIDEATERLLEINHARADQEASEVRQLQYRAAWLLAGLTLIWTIFAVLTGRWVASLILDRQTRMNRAMGLLEERNRELDAFAARVAHDLRGPLSAISLASGQFKLRGTYDEGTGGILKRAVARMEAMIHDLLTLSRVGAQIKGTACRVADVVAAVQEDLKPVVESVGGSLRIDAADATVPCSQGPLREVLWNLGENAVKYRRPEVQLQVEIRGRIMVNRYELTVSDNGTGMSPAVANHAFEAFFRAAEAESTPGTGLGLSVVKRVVESSGGSISLDSERGRGTMFRILMPLHVRKAA